MAGLGKIKRKLSVKSSMKSVLENGSRCKGPVVSELMVHSKQGNSSIRCGLNGQQRLGYVES